MTVGRYQKVTTSTIFFISIPAVIIMIAIIRSFRRRFSAARMRRKERRRRQAIRTSAVAQAKGLAEKIKFAAHSRAPQEEKNAASERMQQVEELVKRFDLDFLRDLGINGSTLRRHAHMATVDEHEARKKLALIRQGKFSAPRKRSEDTILPSNVIPLPTGGVAPVITTADSKTQRAREKSGTDCEDD